MSAIAIRPERPQDCAAIRTVTEAAFAEAGHSDGTEADIVERLRAAGDLALSLVAEDEAGIVGHAAVSPVTVSDGSQHWYGLGPIGVLPRVRSRGIGTALMQRAIADMRERGAHGIVVLGEPEFYGRFGFEADPRLAYPGATGGYFQRLVMEGEPPRGTVRYAPAFG